MTVLSDIQAAVFAALSTETGSPPAYPTVAGSSVYMPKDWPVQQSNVPILKIDQPTETKESLGKSGIKFLSTCHLEVIGEVSSPATSSDASAGAVLTALGIFQREIEVAIIGNPVLFGGSAVGLIEQMKSVTTKMATNADGALVRGAVSMTFEMTYYQGEEDFQQPTLTQIQRFHLYADLINVADPTGTYTPPMDYTPTSEPRTIGPDGRIEGEIEVEITQ